MSSKNSYNVNNHNDPQTWVPMSFIEGAIQGLRTIGSTTAYWFPFTSASKNDTTHDEPNISEDTNIVYYSLPEQQSFKAGTEFLTLLRQKIEDETIDENEKLPECFYEAAEHKVFLKKNYITKDHPEPETLGKTKDDKVQIKTDHFLNFKELNNKKLKTYGDVLKIKNLPRYLEEKRIEATENIMVESLLKESAKMRTAIVCQHLPATRPITLVMPVHLGGHYHTYAARISEDDSVELLAISTIMGYPDKVVLDGMKEGILEALKMNKKKIAKPLQAYLSQGDGVSCGPISTTVSLQVNPNIPLSMQINQLENAISCYKRNRSIVKKALAGVYYSVAGLRLKDENNSKDLPSASKIQKETAKYVGFFNKVRPCAFGIHLQHGDESAIFGARIGKDFCELICISSLDEEYNVEVLEGIKNGIKKALSVGDDFFHDPIICDENEGTEVTVAPTTNLVAVRIKSDEALSTQIDHLKHSVFGSKAFRKKLKEDECETCYSFCSPNMSTEQIQATRDSWEQNLNTQLAHIPPAPPKKKIVKTTAKKPSLLKKSIDKALRNSAAALLNDNASLEMLEILKRKVESTPARLPLAKRLALAEASIKKEKKATTEKRVVQWAAADLLEALYEQQQRDKEHHLKVAIATSIVGILLPGISHLLIWSIYSALHKNDVIKLTFDRESFEKFKQEDKPNFSIEKRITNYDKMPLKKQTNKKNKKVSYFFKSVYTDETDFNGKPSDKFSILLLNKEKAERLQSEFQEWEEKHTFDVAAAAA